MRELRVVRDALNGPRPWLVMGQSFDNRKAWVDIARFPDADSAFAYIADVTMRNGVLCNPASQRGRAAS
jgi:hypothetical protein